MLKHRLQRPQNPNRVVLLGGSGFLGTRLSALLRQQGTEVLSLSSKDLDLSVASSVDQLKQILKAEDSLVMASALTPDKGRDVRTLMKNLSMAQNVAEYIEQKTLAHLTYISSDAVYDMSVNPVREGSPCTPTDLYAAMHITREIVFKVAAQKSKTPYLVLRPCAIYGSGDTHNSYGPNRFLRTAVKEKKISLFGGGEEKRDHLYIDDAARLVSACLSFQSEGVLNLATGTSASFFDVASQVANVVGNETKIECSPRANPVTYRHFDITETLRAFPDFRFTSLREGLASFYKTDMRG
ncbi:MAG: NAD(P)-dependent oxidoreductase [Bdellovibrionota bacterium]